MLGTATSSSLSTASASEDIYEAYIWALIIQAAASEQFTVSYLNANQQTVSQFVFRTSPGAIYSSVHPYTFARLEYPGCPTLEAHLGIYVSGRSRVVHECDLAVLYKNEADTCRTNSVHPRSSKLVLAVECKFYSTNLSVDLARSFLGLTEEIMQSDRYFVSNTSSNSVAKVLTCHSRFWDTNVSPLNGHNRDRLRNRFETTLKHFKAEFA